MDVGRRRLRIIKDNPSDRQTVSPCRTRILIYRHAQTAQTARVRDVKQNVRVGDLAGRAFLDLPDEGHPRRTPDRAGLVEGLPYQSTRNIRPGTNADADRP